MHMRSEQTHATGIRTRTNLSERDVCDAIHKFPYAIQSHAAQLGPLPQHSLETDVSKPIS